MKKQQKKLIFNECNEVIGQKIDRRILWNIISR